MSQLQRNSSRALDIIHKIAASTVILGTCYIGYDLATRFWSIRQRRIAWEKENPDYVREFHEKKKNEKENEKINRDEEKRIKTEKLLSLIQQQEKQQKTEKA